MRSKVLPAPFVAALALAGAGFIQAQEAPPTEALPTLDAQFEPLRAAFNRDADEVRLLLLLDPT